MRRPAAALPAVLFALAITSALAVGGAYSARHLAGSSRLQRLAAQLDPVAEQAVVQTVAAWDTIARREQAVGTTATGPDFRVGSIVAQAWITRLTPSTWWVVGEAAMENPPRFRRRHSVVLFAPLSTPTLASPRAWSELP